MTEQSDETPTPATRTALARRLLREAKRQHAQGQIEYSDVVKAADAYIEAVMDAQRAAGKRVIRMTRAQAIRAAFY